MNAASVTDIETLAELVEGTGTTIEAIECQREGVNGYYQYDPTNKIDRLVICTNSVDVHDSDAVWEVLVHESVHVMQACNNGPIIKDTHIPRVLRQLKAYAPHYYNLLENSYRGDHRRYEVEAFWMELQEPHIAHQWMRDYCYRDNSQV